MNNKMAKQNKLNESLEFDVRSTFGSIKKSFMSDPSYVYEKAVDLYLSGSVSEASACLSTGTSIHQHLPSVSLRGIIAYVNEDYETATLLFKQVVKADESATLDAYFAGDSLLHLRNMDSYNYFGIVEGGRDNDSSLQVVAGANPQVYSPSEKVFDLVLKKAKSDFVSFNGLKRFHKDLFLVQKRFPKNDGLVDIASSELLSEAYKLLSKEKYEDAFNMLVDVCEFSHISTDAGVIVNKVIDHYRKQDNKSSKLALNKIYERCSTKRHFGVSSNIKNNLAKFIDKPTTVFLKSLYGDDYRSKFSKVAGKVSGAALATSNLFLYKPWMLDVITADYKASPSFFSFERDSRNLLENGALYGGINGLVLGLTVLSTIALVSSKPIKKTLSNFKYPEWLLPGLSLTGFVGGSLGGILGGPDGVVALSYLGPAAFWGVWEMVRYSIKYS